MMFAPWKTLALLTFLLPAAAPARAGDHAVRERDVVVVDGDDLASLEGDEPLILLGEGRSYIGVRLLEMTPDLREHFGAPRDAGVLVGEVEADSPASKAGLRVGDILTRAGGNRIDSVRDLTRAIRRRKGGEKVELEVVRDRSEKRLGVEVAERKGHDWGLGELPSFDTKAFVMPKFGPKIRARLDGLQGLEDRLQDLEKRLKDLEKRLPAR